MDGKQENDFWDLDSQNLSITNIQAEVERMGEGEKINILNLTKEHLMYIHSAMCVFNEIGSTQQEFINKMNKMRDELMDALQRLGSHQLPHLTPSTWGASSGGTTTSFQQGLQQGGTP